MHPHDMRDGSVVEVAIEPKAPADRDRLLTALQAATADDPSLRYTYDDASGQCVLGGQSEDHLDEAVHKIRQAHGIAFELGAPQVAYRERLTRAVEIAYSHTEILSGTGEFARVRILFEPSDAGSGFVFENAAPSAALLEAHVSGVREGLEAARRNGLVAGFPVIDFKATLTDGAYHEVDSNRRVFELAAREAFRMIREKRVVELLEPIYAAEVAVPDWSLGNIVGDLNRRRGQVSSVDSQGESSLVTALVPVSNMFGYLNNLRSLTKGLGTVSLRLDHYAPVPRGTSDDDPRFPPAAAMRMRA